MLVKNSPLRGGQAREKICRQGSLARGNQHLLLMNSSWKLGSNRTRILEALSFLVWLRLNLRSSNMSLQLLPKHNG